MKQTSCVIAAILMLTVMVTSCSKSGDAGPQGQPGPAGTANVIYSDWFDLTFDTIAGANGIDTFLYVAAKSAPDLTNDILNRGEVKVYINTGTAAAPSVYPLPLTDFYAFTSLFSVNVFFEEGQINFYGAEDSDPATIYQDPSTFIFDGDKYFQYRYVIIPGGTNATSSVNWNNYYEVKQALQLKD